jgi:hypothetical protein
VESYLFLEYAALGTEFHFFVHASTGAAGGLALLAAVRGLAQTRAGGRGLSRAAWLISPWLAAVVGHLFAAWPDVLFLGSDIPHAMWMDVFAAHVRIHFVPAPLLWLFAAFVLAVTAAAASQIGRHRLGVVAAALTVAWLGLGLALRAPLPGSVEELRADPGLAASAQAARSG